MDQRPQICSWGSDSSLHKLSTLPRQPPSNSSPRCSPMGPSAFSYLQATWPSQGQWNACAAWQRTSIVPKASLVAILRIPSPEILLSTLLLFVRHFCHGDYRICEFPCKPNRQIPRQGRRLSSMISPNLQYFYPTTMKGSFAMSFRVRHTVSISTGTNQLFQITEVMAKPMRLMA